MLIRISLIVALIGALAVGGLNVFVVKDKINTLVTDRDTQRDGRTRAEGEREKAKKDLAKAEKDLTQSQQDLAEARTEREKAVATAAAQVKKADELSGKLAKTSQDLDATQTKLAQYVATGVSADQVGKFNRALKDSQEALEIAKRLVRKNDVVLLKGSRGVRLETVFEGF